MPRHLLRWQKGYLMSGAATSSSRFGWSVISMRLFFARPSADSLLPTGSNSPYPAADKDRGAVALPHEPSADRPAHLQLVADLQSVVQESGDLTAGQSLDGELDVVGAVRSGGN